VSGPLRVTWTQPEDLIVHEFAQSRHDGVDVSTFEARWVAAGGDLTVPKVGATVGSSHLRPLATVLIAELDELRDVDSVLPSTERQEHAWSAPRMPREELFDRLHGAWLGRAVGCLLGKPVEKIQREGIREILSSAGRWPLDRYFSAEGVPAEVLERWPWNRRSRETSLLENIDGMPEDDDLNFPLLNLALVEEVGYDFTAAHVATAWLANLPAGRVFTAERIAYRNLLLGHAPPQSAAVGNPFREWIGAQIRADLYGWINPGDSGAAAEMASRDAVVSHTGNGVHAAVFVAALVAESFVNPKIADSIEVALGFVPSDSGVAQAVRFGCDSASGDWEQTVDAIAERYADFHWVHALNNLCLVAAALTAGDGDFERSICAVVMGGWDTDSNGATVGSVLGARVGAKAMPERWTAPLDNRLTTSLPDFDTVGFDELATRTLSLATGPRSGC